jgi:hypothetical protein
MWIQFTGPSCGLFSRIRACGFSSPGLVADSSKHGIEPSGSVEGGDILTSLVALKFSRPLLP